MASLEALPNGTYRVVWRQDGAKQRERFPTRQAADRFLADVERQDNHWPRGWLPGHGWRDEVPELNAPLFAEWAVRAINARATANERTRADYHRDATRHLYPVFGATPVDRIDRQQVGEWLIGLQRAGLSPKTIKNVQTLASTIMADAIEARHAASNPFRGAIRSLPTVKQEEMVFLTRQEFETLLRLTPEHYKPLVLTLFMTGLRWSEATALRVADVDLLGRRITVVRAWKRTPGNYMVIGEPKSRRSRRTLTISRRLADALVPLTIDRAADELLFLSQQGRAVSHSNFRYRVWVPLLDAINAEHVEKRPRIHDARHSHASWLIADGASAYTVQRRLGHESIDTTISTYTHLMPEQDEALDRLLNMHDEPLTTEAAKVLDR